MQNDTKFKIEGEIEGHSSGKNTGGNVVKRKNYKPALLFFILLSILLFLLSGVLAYSHFFGSKDDPQTDGISSDSLALIQAQNDSLNDILVEQQMTIDRLREESGMDSSGVYYEVQIGNFKDFNLDAYLEEMANLRQEKYEGGNKFLLGRFRSYKKALLFENDLKRLGMSDVFIKGRIEGKLVSKEEALEYERSRR